MEEIVYRPHHEAVLKACIRDFLKGNLPVLDLETSAICRHALCIYCDSKVGPAMPNELTKNEMRALLEEALKEGVKWLYICGLGEPIDDPNFHQVILPFINEYDVNISIFTNGLGITEELVSKFPVEKVNLIVKCDSLNEVTFDALLGRRGVARRIYAAIELLIDHGFGDQGGGITNLALSIVPTKINKEDVIDVVRFCKEMRLFPSIGELEMAGRAVRIFAQLALSHEELVSLKKQVENVLGFHYERKICPAAIAGLHITNVGNCVVDKETGISCSWFTLREPSYISLGNVRECRLRTLMERMMKYRAEILHKINITSIMQKIGGIVFGGCGGPPTKLITYYLRVMEAKLGSNCNY